LKYFNAAFFHVTKADSDYPQKIKLDLSFKKERNSYRSGWNNMRVSKRQKIIFLVNCPFNWTQTPNGEFRLSWSLSLSNDIASKYSSWLKYYSTVHTNKGIIHSRRVGKWVNPHS